MLLLKLLKWIGTTFFKISLDLFDLKNWSQALHMAPLSRILGFPPLIFQANQVFGGGGDVRNFSAITYLWNGMIMVASQFSVEWRDVDAETAAETMQKLTDEGIEGQERLDLINSSLVGYYLKEQPNVLHKGLAAKLIIKVLNLQLDRKFLEKGKQVRKQLKEETINHLKYLENNKKWNKSSSKN